MDSADITAPNEAAAMRSFWRGLVAQRLPTYNGQTTATALTERKGPAMAKMNPAEKKAFPARMAKGRRKAGNAAGMGTKSAGALRSYVIEGQGTERVLGTYRATTPASAISTCMKS